jgi:hypothetical protein
MQTSTEKVETDNQDLILQLQAAFKNPVTQVYFRAGLLACREYMARFVEAQSPEMAQSIRANWWPSLDDDPGAPRLLDFNELTEGEHGTESFREKEVSASVEALPVALGFLVSKAAE